jgi:Zn finger protein HypA/HybF involved in hydrogenase expression
LSWYSKRDRQTTTGKGESMYIGGLEVATACHCRLDETAQTAETDQDCPDCGGTGEILTDKGQKLIDFVERHSRTVSAVAG